MKDYNINLNIEGLSKIYNNEVITYINNITRKQPKSHEKNKFGEVFTPVEIIWHLLNKIEEQNKNICGAVPIKVAQKKLIGFTLKIHGNTFDIAKGIPPTNL